MEIYDEALGLGFRDMTSQSGRYIGPIIQE